MHKFCRWLNVPTHVITNFSGDSNKKTHSNMCNLNTTYIRYQSLIKININNFYVLTIKKKKKKEPYWTVTYEHLQNPSSSPGPQGPPGGPPAPLQQGVQGQENLNALQRAIDSMEEKGMQEDPRYSQLLAIRAKTNGSSVFNQTQMSQLRYWCVKIGARSGDFFFYKLLFQQFFRAQIMAYRMLARSQPLNQQIVMAVQGKRPDGAPQCPTPPSSPFQPQGAGQGQPPTQVRNVFLLFFFLKRLFFLMT